MFIIRIDEVVALYLIFSKIATTEYNSRRHLREDIRQLRKEHDIIISIKSSTSTSINYIWKHGGEKRIRSERAEAANVKRSKKSSCDAFVNFKYDIEWTKKLGD